MAKMSKAQRTNILASHATAGRHNIMTTGAGRRYLLANGWAHGANNVFLPTTAGLIAADVDMDAIHAEALAEDRLPKPRAEEEILFHYHVILVSKAFPTRHQTVRQGRSAQEVCDAMVAIGSYKSVEVAPASPVNGYEGLTFKRGDRASWHVNNVATEGTRGAALPASDPHSTAFPTGSIAANRLPQVSGRWAGATEAERAELLTKAHADALAEDPRTPLPVGAAPGNDGTGVTCVRMDGKHLSHGYARIDMGCITPAEAPAEPLTTIIDRFDLSETTCPGCGETVRVSWPDELRPHHTPLGERCLGDRHSRCESRYEGLRCQRAPHEGGRHVRRPTRQSGLSAWDDADIKPNTPAEARTGISDRTAAALADEIPALRAEIHAVASGLVLGALPTERDMLTRLDRIEAALRAAR